MKRIYRALVVGGVVAATVGATHVASGSGNGSAPSALVSIDPCRLMDTRPKLLVGPRSTPVGAKETYTTNVWGTNGKCTIPDSATAVSLNVTAVNGSEPSFLALFPGGAAVPPTSNLNWVPGSAPSPNKVDVLLSRDGKLSMFNLNGTVDVVIDVFGYYEPSPSSGGAKGDKGDRGAPGAPGAPGPKGDKGDAGAPGAPGLKGDKGDIGATGAQGLPGEPGEKGDPGSPGVQGDKGEPGVAGPTGDKGDQGEPGVAGQPGEPGEKGDKGDQGEPGAQGLPGEKGDKGDQGEPGVAGPKGDQGEPGVAGPKGDKGDQGEPGVAGEPGEPGVAGPKGDQGEPGVAGPKGDQGDTGAVGPQGPAGPAGPAGAIFLDGNSGANRVWFVDDGYTFNGSGLYVGRGANSTREAVQMLVPVSATFTNFYCGQSTPGGTATFRVYINDTASSTTSHCTMSGSATAGSNTTSSFTVNPGDRVSVLVTTTGTGSSTARYVWWGLA